MTESRVVETPRPPSSSPIAAVGSLVAARDLEELVLAASMIPAQLFGARETLVVLQSGSAEIAQRHPATGALGELEGWVRGELASGVGERVSRHGSWLAIGI